MPTTIVIESVAFNQTARCGSVNVNCKSFGVKVSNWTLIQGGPHVTKRLFAICTYDVNNILESLL